MRIERPTPTENWCGRSKSGWVGSPRHDGIVIHDNCFQSVFIILIVIIMYFIIIWVSIMYGWVRVEFLYSLPRASPAMSFAFCLLRIIHGDICKLF